MVARATMRAAAAALLALPASALVAPHPRLRAPRVLRSAPAAAPPTADSPPRCAVVAAEVADGGKAVDVSFGSGATYRFHALWLRDACRDEAHVAAAAGERILTATPVGPLHEMCDPAALRATAVGVADGRLDVSWNGGATASSMLDGAALFELAPAVANGVPRRVSRDVDRELNHRHRRMW